MAQFDPKKTAELTGGGGGGKAKKEAKGGEKKEKTPTRAAVAEEAPADDDGSSTATAIIVKKFGESSTIEKEKKGEKDPFAAFAKSSFVLDKFKRVYSNEDIKTKAIPHFWHNFDADNFSIWLCEYKFPQDLGLMFQSENLITGMFQRLDKLNKNAFASVGVFGKSRDAQIQGLWVWRGQELVFP